jgi:hypothetical protein
MTDRTKVAPDAAAELRRLLARIVLAAGTVGSPGAARDPMDALFEIDAALGTYGERFDDPGWQALR